MGIHHIEIAIANERRLPGERLVEHAAKRIDIDPVIPRLGEDLLRRRVCGRPDELTLTNYVTVEHDKVVSLFVIRNRD